MEHKMKTLANVRMAKFFFPIFNCLYFCYFPYDGKTRSWDRIEDAVFAF